MFNCDRNLFDKNGESIKASVLGFVGKLARRPGSEQFFRLAKTTKQAMLVLSSMESNAARGKKGRSKPDRVFRHSPILWKIYPFIVKRNFEECLPAISIGVGDDQVICSRDDSKPISLTARAILKSSVAVGMGIAATRLPRCLDTQVSPASVGLFDK